MAADWRFARVRVGVAAGGIDNAISDFSQTTSPDLLIVETGDISEAFIKRLGDLAGVCAEGTEAIIVGPMNDVHLYRSLIGMGVRDYLVRPVADHDLMQVVSKTLLDKRGLSQSRLAVVIGAKGGVGASVLAQNIALQAAEDCAQKTLLLDAAGGAGSLGIGFGLEPGSSLAEAIRLAAGGSEDDIRRLLQKGRDNLSVMLAGAEPQLTDNSDADGLERLLERMMRTYPLTVFDASAASRALQKRVLALAAHVTLVATPLLPALRNARSLMSEIKTIRGNLHDVDFVLNMHGVAGGDDVPLADIRAAIEAEPLIKLPYLPKLFTMSEGQGEPVIALKQAADLRRQLMPLTARVAGTAPVAAKQGNAGKGGFLNKIIRK